MSRGDANLSARHVSRRVRPLASHASSRSRRRTRASPAGTDAGRLSRADVIRAGGGHYGKDEPVAAIRPQCGSAGGASPEGDLHRPFDAVEAPP